MNSAARSWIELSEAALAHNLQALRHAAGPDTGVLAVVKANAYGHGAELCAPSLARAGARWFGVTDAAEGARVRQALLRTHCEANSEILVMCGSLREDTATLAEHSLTPVVWTPEHIHAVGHLQHGKVQIEIDTGMGRQGARPGSELKALLDAIRTAGLQLDGVFTHLCGSEVAGSPLTLTQRHRFEQAVAEVRAQNMQPRWLHIGNSSTLDNIDCTSPIGPWLTELANSIGAHAMVRAGLALYGYTLPIQQPVADNVPASAAKLRPHLQPVLTWKARILSTRTLAAGDSIGYGATFTASRPTRVALLPVGYADGLRRELSNPTTAIACAGPPGASFPDGSQLEPDNGVSTGGWAIAHAADGASHRCPILGRISMNLTVIDISAVHTLGPGDAVTLLGPGITADDHARMARTIPYEILCGIQCTARLLQPSDGL